MATYFDRYNKFRVNGSVKPVPGIPIPQAGSDKFAVYKKGVTRLDIISNTYYK